MMMELIPQLLLPTLIAFVSCIGFCMIFNIRDKNMLIAAVGGALAWAVYLIVDHYADSVMANFMGGIFVSLYAEIMARVRRMPSTCILIIGLLPLVPGSGIYYTMKYYVQGQYADFAARGMATLTAAGAIALGVMLVISMVRMFLHIQHNRVRKLKKLKLHK